MGASAAALSPERRAKLEGMSQDDQMKLQKQVEELKSLGLSQEAAIERMIKEFEDAVDNDWAWGMPGKDVVRRDSIYSDDDTPRGSESKSAPHSASGTPMRGSPLKDRAEAK
tara:strand:- start:665 stop:1000 length:336 start_codon:yes stop_codon:yes gene_type:complete